MINGNDLRALRLHANRTTSQMAEIAQVTRQTYENWEKDVGQPKINQFISLCVHCGLDASGLVRSLKSITSQFLKNGPNKRKGESYARSSKQ
ncbi:helix-turn-helix transcriptional regulator [Aliiglaciecola sp. CAU 1673]|uniref:helix-turn-helix transcriptional regulator n=1 Tax=Aliiglaciecola sp. CAU 1673 TaxID=3032595 RepID=UPI0023DB2E2C|nr:helix-turn-helix transcriptional regulator [Aliiglaciecola sp. CAU 1673]MDF2177012.1 helix-turn-helix transcriptional regulator [Aliiglaciecola sp. CAU 1673]